MEITEPFYIPGATKSGALESITVAVMRFTTFI